MMRGPITLPGMARHTDIAVLLLRLYLGGFLIWGVWDNITSAERMAEFAGFLTAIGSPLPELAAPVSVGAQFLVGVLLIPGVLTRWAGMLLAVNFLVAVALIGTMIERNLHLSLSLYGEFFIFTRPITLFLFIILLVTSALPFIRMRRRKRITVVMPTV